MDQYNESAELGEELHSWENETDHSLFVYPLDYRIIATLVQSLIFILGVSGNVVVVVVIFRTRSLQSATYLYLASLAVADLVVLISAVPEALVVHHLGQQWLIGQVGCSLFIFSNFLGINAGSLSILGFTVEQYIAVCGRSPSKSWFSSHTQTTIGGLWLFAVLYCSPWLGLTEVRSDPEDPSREQCELRLSPQAYLGLFGSDFLLFYVIPLVVAVICYGRIAVILVRTGSYRSWESPVRGSFADNSNLAAVNELTSSLSQAIKPLGRLQKSLTKGERFVTPQSRKQVLRMLVMIVVLFAVAWLPFRGLLIYNSFAAEPWTNIWYFFVAKTLIYFNSAMNPFLYNLMSQRFRLAFKRIVLCRTTTAYKRRKASHNSSFARNHAAQDALLLYS